MLSGNLTCELSAGFTSHYPHRVHITSFRGSPLRKTMYVPPKQTSSSVDNSVQELLPKGNTNQTAEGLDFSALQSPSTSGFSFLKHFPMPGYHIPEPVICCFSFMF